MRHENDWGAGSGRERTAAAPVAAPGSARRPVRSAFPDRRSGAPEANVRSGRDWRCAVPSSVAGAGAAGCALRLVLAALVPFALALGTPALGTPALGTLTLGGPAWAQGTGGLPASGSAPAGGDPPSSGIESPQDQAGDLAALRRELIEAARGVMSQHRTVLEIEADLAALTAAEAERQARLAAARQQLAALLAALQRLARVPPEALIARPEAPVDTVRSTLLLRTAIPTIEARARTLRVELDALAELRRELAERRAAATAARSELEAGVASLGTLVGRREALLEVARRGMPPHPGAEPALSGQARDLSDLLRQLDRHDRPGLPAGSPSPTPPPELLPEEGTIPPDPVPGQVAAVTLRPIPAPAVVGGVLLPTSGTIQVGFGDTDRFGRSSSGLSIGSFPGAPVVAPLDGTVRFVGPFRSYGHILIIEHGGGYHSLIAGVGEIDARIGQEVLAGEPVAIMGSPSSGLTAAPTLYFELRRDGQPVDPIPGLIAAQGRGRG